MQTRLQSIILLFAILFSFNTATLAATVIASDPYGAEGSSDWHPGTGGTATFTISIDSSTPTNRVVPFTLGGTATEGADYTAVARFVTIPAGQTSADLTITPINDSEDEDFEKVTLTISASGSSAWVMIGSDDPYGMNPVSTPALNVEATAPSASEDGTNGTFTITSLGGQPHFDLVIKYSLSGTATNGTDYIQLTGWTVMNANETTATVTIAVLDDHDAEGIENVTLTLINEPYYGLSGSSNATVVIEDNDPPGSLTLTSTAGEHGTISPSGDIFTVAGTNVDFTIVSNPYYHVEDVTTNGVSIGAVSLFTWSNVLTNGSIHVAFSENLAYGEVPEWWLAQYGWTNDFDSAALNDQDGDGLATWQEYWLINRLSPTNGNDNIADIGLYTADSISDLDMGSLMLQNSNGWMQLSLQLEQCTNLTEGTWGPAGDAVEWSHQAPEDKAFFRVRGN